MSNTTRTHMGSTSTLDITVENERITIKLGNRVLLDTPLEAYLCTCHSTHGSMFGFPIIEALRVTYKAYEDAKYA
jgi:hypothetical protein